MQQVQRFSLLPKSYFQSIPSYPHSLQRKPQASDSFVRFGKANGSSSKSRRASFFLSIPVLVALLSSIAACAPANNGSTSCSNAPINTGQTSTDVTISPRPLGYQYSGHLGGAQISISNSTKGWGENIDGQFNGDPVSMQDNPGVWGETMSGNFECRSVNLKVTPAVFGHDINGTFMGKTVKVNMRPEDIINEHLVGTINGKKVDLTFGPNIIGHHINGTFEGQDVDLNINPQLPINEDLSGQIHLSADSIPDFAAILIIEHILYEESQSSSSSSSDAVGNATAQGSSNNQAQTIQIEDLAHSKYQDLMPFLVSAKPH